MCDLGCGNLKGLPAIGGALGHACVGGSCVNPKPLLFCWCVCVQCLHMLTQVGECMHYIAVQPDVAPPAIHNGLHAVSVWRSTRHNSQLCGGGLHDGSRWGAKASTHCTAAGGTVGR